MTGGPVKSLETPALVVDVDVMDANIRRGMDRLAGKRRGAAYTLSLHDALPSRKSVV